MIRAITLAMVLTALALLLYLALADHQTGSQQAHDSGQQVGNGGALKTGVDQ